MVVLVIPPICEEWFRGVLMDEVQELGMLWAIVIQAIGFAVYHLIYTGYPATYCRCTVWLAALAHGNESRDWRAYHQYLLAVAWLAGWFEPLETHSGSFWYLYLSLFAAIFTVERSVETGRFQMISRAARSGL